MPTEPRKQMRLAVIVLLVVVSILLVAYFTLFRTTMVPAYQNIRQSDASAIIAQLDKGGIPHELANDGHDVLVPESRVSEARVAVAGANLTMGGTVGFELFNDSDMGLTEFAQKINFQRAVQGELARTIMMTQGVEFARVHLALPERSIFRANQGAPSAAVTVHMAPSNLLTKSRVDGIRQLVASSVPGLSQAAVAVLDNNGVIVSPVMAAVGGAGARDEQSALESYYQARAREVIGSLAPDLAFDVVVDARQVVGTAQSADPPTAEGGRGLLGRDEVVMTVLVRTQAPLPAELEGRIKNALTTSLSLRQENGDALRFVTGAVGVEQTPVVAATDRLPAEQTTSLASPDPTLPGGSGPDWRLWAAVAGAALLAFLLLRPRRRLDTAATASFAEQLRASALGGMGRMAADPETFPALVKRFEQLGGPDRTAVLATLSPADRDQVVAAMAQLERNRREEALAARRAGRRYAAYSPWLAQIVRASSSREGDDDGITSATRLALVDAHAAMEADDDGMASGPWSWLRRLGEQLIDGERKPT